MLLYIYTQRFIYLHTAFSPTYPFLSPHHTHRERLELMAFSKFMASLAILIMVLLPLMAKGDPYIPPILSPAIENICNEVECGRGSCQTALGSPFNFRCICENGWKRTRLDDETDLEFLPCIIPNCSVQYSCMPAPPPSPPIPRIFSIFEPCYWIYCGGGTCTKRSDYRHTCQCQPGYQNLLNISVFPCYNECAIGSECERVGVRLSNSTTSNTPPAPGAINAPADTNAPGNQATSFLPGKFHWITILLMSLVIAQWK